MSPDAPTSTAGCIVCPVCEVEIPVGLSPPRLCATPDRRSVMIVRLQLDDVWAHAWTHGIEPG